MEIDEIKLLKTIKLAAQIILENGGETYRAEETIKYICNSCSIKDIEAIATPTGFYVSICSDGAESKTVVKRINKRTINLQKLNDVNNISRQLSLHSISLDDALEQLKIIEKSTGNHSKFSMFYPAISSAFFTVLFGGGIFEFIAAFFAGILVTLISKQFENIHSSQFFSGIISGMVIAIIAISATFIAGNGNYNFIIVGSMMPLLPGLAMTNAIRDTIRGDLISGTARAAEAILVASSLAAGAGVIIYFAYSMGILKVYGGQMDIKIIFQMIYCFGASLFYALIMNAPKKILIHSSVIASLGYLIYIIFVNMGSLKLGFFLGTTAVAFIGEIYARKFKMPATIFVFPGVIPIVPGFGLYQTMYAFVQNDIFSALETGVNTLVNIGAMAVAMAMVGLLTSKIKFNIIK